MPLRPIPAGLEGVAFRVSEADDVGIRPRSRSPRLTRPFHGMRGIDLGESLVDRCRAFEALMRPGQFFSHTTAIALWTGIVFDDAVHVSVGFPRTPPRARGVLGHSLRNAVWVLHGGSPVASPASAWRQSAALLSELQLVIAGDALVGTARGRGRDIAPITDIGDLVAAHIAAGRARGAVAASGALGLVRAGVGSPQETLLRRALADGGLPEPVADLPVTVGGGRVWHPDLAYPSHRIAIEYEGDEHRRDRRRWQRDITRREAFEDAGWRVVRVTSLDLRNPAGLVGRLRRLLSTRADLHLRGSDRVVRHDSMGT